MIKATKGKIKATLLVSSNDQRINQVLAAEEEMVVDRYPATKIIEMAGRRVYQVPFILESSPLSPSQSFSMASKKKKCELTLIIALGVHYPYQSPSISMELGKPFSEIGKAYMQEEHLLALSGEINEAIAPSVDLGMGSVLQIIQMVEDDVLTFSPAKNIRKNCQPCLLKVASSGESLHEKESLTRGKPSSTPVPLREKDGLKLSIFATHLLMKCCFLRYPESVEEAKAIFEQLHRYFLLESHLIPYGSQLYPWRDEQMKALREEIEASHRHPSAPVELLKWLWKIPSGVSTTHASTGRYQQEFIEGKLLGSGGFASVFLCRKKLDGRISAIKKVVMHKNETKKVLREVRMLANLNHKNVVRYIDCWVENGYSKDLRCFVEELEKESTDSDSNEDNDEEEDNSSSSSSSTGSDASSRLATLYNDADVESEGSTEASSSQNGDEKGEEAQRKRNYQTLYIQMELCSPITLRTLLIGDGRGHTVFRTAEGIKIASSILRQLLGVIADTHDSFIVHRDLKPENILFNASETDPLAITDTTIRVVDFGLAKEMKRNPAFHGQVASLSAADDGSLFLEHLGDTLMGTKYESECYGTVLYAAPELSSRNDALTTSEKVDEFSIGMIALEMWLAISGLDSRETTSIMTETWVNSNAELPSWFVEKHSGIAEIIRSLLHHDPSERKSCHEVLQHHSFPGDPPELIEALQTIDRFGTNIVGAVMQHVSQLDYQMQGPSDKEKLFYARMCSPQWLQLVNVSEMIARIHGYAHVPLLKTHLPMNKKTKDYVVNATGRCYLYSPFPHYALATLLFSLPHNENLPSIFSLYCKHKPYLTFTTPFFTTKNPLELYAEPFCCFFHLLSCTKGSGTVRIVISHTRWLALTLPLKGMYDSVGGGTAGFDSPPRFRRRGFTRISGSPKFVPSPPKEEDDVEGITSPLPGNGSFSFPSFRKQGSVGGSAGSSYGGGFPLSYYIVEKNHHFDEVLQTLQSDMNTDFGITLLEDEYLKEVRNFVSALQTTKDVFEKYLPGFNLEIALSPFLEPSKDMIDRGIILSDGVFTVCEVECEEETSKGKLPAATGVSGVQEGMRCPVAFGCTIDSTITQLAPPYRSSPEDEGKEFSALSPVGADFLKGKRRHAFVFSIDGFQFVDVFSSSPLSFRGSFSVIDGVGLRATEKNTRQTIGIAAALWFANFRATLAYRDDEKENTFLHKSVRYVLHSETSLMLANTKRPVSLNKQTISEANVRDFFLSRIIEEISSERARDNPQMNKRIPGILGSTNPDNTSAEEQSEQRKEKHLKGKLRKKKERK